MNIYFACTITGGRQFQPVYAALTRALLDAGHVVPTAHLAEPGVLDEERVIDPAEVYSRDAAWIRACDLLVAEVSVPSHGVGYEIGLALSLGKPVLCLYQRGRAVSKMITGNPDPNLRVRTYEHARQAVGVLLESLSAGPFL